VLHIDPTSENGISSEKRTADRVTQEKKVVYMAITIADQTYGRPGIGSQQIEANLKRSPVAQG